MLQVSFDSSNFAEVLVLSRVPSGWWDVTLVISFIVLAGGLPCELLPLSSTKFICVQ